MRIIGLAFVSTKTVKNGDLAGFPQTYAYGDGLWGIEVPFLGGTKEFSGPNGTRDDEEPANLWQQYRDWCNEVLETHKVYRAPDGVEGSMSFFRREAKRGNLHGCLIKL